MHSNLLSACIQPNEGAHLRVESKLAGEMRVAPVDLELHYRGPAHGQQLPDAYLRLLQDALEGDPTLFIRSDQVEKAWRIVAPFLEAGTSSKPLPLRKYAVGSWGPGASDALLAQHGDA